MNPENKNLSNDGETIEYPYLPDGRKIEYVRPDNEFMRAAQSLADKSTCTKQKTGAVIVKNNQVIAQGSNTGEVVVKVCPREEQGFTTGTGYELCKDTCKQGGHSEEAAVRDGQSREINIAGADLYLAGHWWCCQPCWEAMIGAGIEHVYLSEDSKPK